MKIQKTILLALVVALLCCGVLPVQAAEISAPPADQISSDLNYASVSKSFPVEIEMGDAGTLSTGEDGMQMVYVKASISKASSSSVVVSITTAANIKCMEIGGSVGIERWINNKWELYKSFSRWEYGVSTMTATEEFPVETGYYYRISVTHMATSEYSVKFGYSTTKSVLVN